MSQQDIINYLTTKKNKFVDTNEMLVHIKNINYVSLCAGCRKLKFNGEINFKKKKIRGVVKYFYKYKK